MSEVIHVVCACGAPYRVPLHMAGKRAKCKKCGGPVDIPKPPPPEEEDVYTLAEDDEFIVDAGVAADSAVISGHAVVASAPMADGGPAPRSSSSGTGSLRAYFKDCMWSVLFIAEPGNVTGYLGVSFIAALQAVVVFGGCFGVIGGILLSCWVVSFLFNVILNSANGERELPELAWQDGLLDDVIAPMIKYLSSIAVVMIPVIAYALVSGVGGFGSAMSIAGAIIATLHWPMAILLTPTQDPVFWGLGIAGAFLWPMSALIVGLGGVSSFGRPDLIARTFVMTLVPYVLTVAMVGGAFGLSTLSIHGLIAGTDSPIALMFILRIVELYFQIVAMQCIGLFYHHFKHRFAWSWG